MAFMNFLVLAEVAFKSLFLEASWNGRSQQGLGFAASLEPALNAIYEPGERREEARRRSLFFFNSHPVMSGFLLGLAIEMEKKVAMGRMTEYTYGLRLKSASISLARIGDRLFWKTWLPFCSLLSVWAVISFESLWGALLLPVLYCALALPVRFYGFYLGYQKGMDILDRKIFIFYAKCLDVILYIIAILVGASTLVLLNRRLDHLGSDFLPFFWLAALAALGAVFALRYLSCKSKLVGLWHPIAIVVLMIILMLIGQ